MSRSPIYPGWEVLEIIVFTVGTMSSIWIIGPKISASTELQILLWILIIIASLYIVWISPFLIHKNKFNEFKLFPFTNRNNTGSFQNSWKTYTLFTMTAVIFLIGYTLLWHPETLQTFNIKAFLIKFSGYLITGFIQVAIFFVFILTRLQKIAEAYLRTTNICFVQIFTVLGTAIIFSAFHYPNLALMGCTFVTGLFWSWIYYHKPNILLMSLSFAILGTILHRVVQLQMRIGPFYENPDLYIVREIVVGLKALIGDLY